MSIVDIVQPELATGLRADIYGSDAHALGYVPSHSLVMGLRPEAYAAWRALQQAIAGSLGQRRYELVTLAAAQALGSRACLLAHVNKSLGFMGEEQLVLLMRNYHDAGLSASEVAMMDFAAKLSTNAASMDDADSVPLRRAGFSDTEIVDVTLAAAARNYFSKALQALAVEVDVPPGLSPAMLLAVNETLAVQEPATGTPTDVE
ncbi:carboxymuconolactone decarboxylase [Arthrobacter alpinus]|uniref:carboxymuconolactone decarboxylase family protein n=1 Tax=Arthrobacter alpinus TaxID=656366 RepID=UPI0005CAAD3A|nr:carboxymuconolactone decarboxylase family protein [Arthrobacter alpinus]ALV44925.1 carboxymuconolactone decarboxylase [Arthrobacter alpinus]